MKFTKFDNGSKELQSIKSDLSDNSLFYIDQTNAPMKVVLPMTLGRTNSMELAAVQQ